MKPPYPGLSKDESPFNPSVVCRLRTHHPHPFSPSLTDRANRAPGSTILALRGLLCVPLLVAGCGLFDTREPEDPSVIRSTFDPPTEPSIVLGNIEASFRELNEVNYLKCFTDSLSGGELEFYPTAEAASRYGIFLNWSKAQEQEYFLNIRSRLPTGSVLSLTFDPPSVQSQTSDSSQVEVAYDLVVPHGQQSVPDRGRGRAQFVLVLDRRTGFWAIRRWTDLGIDATTTSWSDIKGAFSQ